MKEQFPPPDMPEKQESKDSHYEHSLWERSGDYIRPVALFLTLWAAGKMLPIKTAEASFNPQNSQEILLTKETATVIDGFKTFYKNLDIKTTHDGVRYFTDAFIVTLFPEGSDIENSQPFGAGVYKTKYINQEEWRIDYITGIPFSKNPLVTKTIHPHEDIVKMFPTSFMTMYQEAIDGIFSKALVAKALRNAPENKSEEMNKVIADMQADIERLEKNFGPYSCDRKKLEQLL